MPKRFTLILIKTVLCLGACWWSAVAQTATSQVGGVVSDPSHAVIPGATVTATNEATGVVMHQNTTGSGVFQFSSIPPGSYTLTIEAGGFKTERRTGVIVNVGTPVTSNFTLEVGATAETVTVAASSVALTTNNATLGEVIDRREVAELPLNGRNVQMLITVQPGMVETTGGEINVNGGRSYSANLTIDGIDGNESSAPGLTKNLYGINPDNVQEINVVTSNPDAMVGRNSGVNISAATRSGTNQFHGSMFDFFRNTDLNAADFLGKAKGIAKQQLHMNQYGVSVGGPIRKNKTFFFGSYQAQYTNVAVPIEQAAGSAVTVYSPTARSGVFRYFVANPSAPFSIGGSTITKNSPLLVNNLTGALNPGVRTCTSPTDSSCVASFNIVGNDPLGLGVDPNIAKVFAKEPTVNNYGAGDGLNYGGYSWNSPYQIRGPYYMARLDHMINENNTIFGRYIYAQNNTLNGDPANSNPQVLPGFAPEGESYWPAHNFAMGYRHVFSPLAMNDLTVGFSRVKLLYTQGEATPGFPQTLIPWSFNLVTTPWFSAPSVSRTLTTPQIIDNFTFTKGSHIISAGANIRLYEQNDYRGSVGGQNLTPVISLSASTRPPSGFALPAVASSTVAGINSSDLANLQSAINDLLGIPATITQRFNGNLKNNTYLPYLSNGHVTMYDEGYRMKQYDSYVQDVWKVRPNLTVTYGVRWEINMPPTEAGGRVYVPNVPVNGTQGPVTFTHADTFFPRKNLDAFGPRLSVAWNPGGEKNLIRAGYTMAYDAMATLPITAVASSVPGEVATCGVTLTATGATTTTGCSPVSNVRLGQGFATSLSVSSLLPQSFVNPPNQVKSNAPAIGVFAPDMKIPTVHEWNLTFQRQLRDDTVVSIAYVGKRGTRLYRNYNINQVNAGPILPSFLTMKQNVANKCNADGTGCPSGVVGTPIPIVQSGLVAASFVNSSTSSTDLAQNAAGNFATRIENSTTAAGLRPNEQFNTINYLDSGGDSYYHSLQATFRKRFAAGLTLGGAYTFSKSIDDGSSDPTGASVSISATALSDISNWRNMRARSNFNRASVLTMNSVYQLPFGKGKRYLSTASKPLNTIAGGWSLSGIGLYQSGQPFSVYSGALTENGTYQSFAALTGPLPVAKLQDQAGIVGPVLFTSTNGFALPAPGSNGAGRNLFTGPSFFNIDMTASKELVVGERYHITLRGEAYNLLNHMNWTTGTVSILSSTFGQGLGEVGSASTRNVVRSSSGEPERVIQLVLRLSF